MKGSNSILAAGMLVARVGTRDSWKIARALELIVRKPKGSKYHYSTLHRPKVGIQELLSGPGLLHIGLRRSFGKGDFLPRLPEADAVMGYPSTPAPYYHPEFSVFVADEG